MAELHRDPLEQANFLARRERKRPKQASLRHAISAAYYALFHLLVFEAARQALPTNNLDLRDQLSRNLTYAEMKSCCQDYTKGNVGPWSRSPIPARLKAIASTFVDLQEARHGADYSNTLRLSRADVLVKISAVTQAFLDWDIVKGNENATVFLFLLSTGKNRRSG